MVRKETLVFHIIFTKRYCPKKCAKAIKKEVTDHKADFNKILRR